MKKHLRILFLILVSVTFSSIQLSSATFGWVSKGNVSIFLNEMALSSWAKGGENLVGATGFFGYGLNYYSPDSNMVWENSLAMGYGFQNSDESGYRKSEDKIDLTSKYGYKAIGKYFYTFSFSFQTQFDKGYKFPNDSDFVSKFFAPAYIIAAAGFDYRPYAKLSFSFYPLAGRSIFVNDEKLANAGAYGVKKAEIDDQGNIISPGEKHRFDFGASANINYSFSPMENVDIATKLDLFNNYTDPKVSNRTNIDINSETSVNMKINNFISANIFLHMIYDQDIPIPLFKKVDGVRTLYGYGSRLQVKQTLGIGFSYNFK
jgi:hypothetical protein